jgi:putative MATE family efflux protein
MMTSAPVEKLVLRLAAPTITTMLISALYNMADTYFVGSLGTSATAAVGIAFPLMAIIQAFGFFFGQGSGNYISRELGALHFDNAKRMVSTGFISALFAGAILTIVGLTTLEPLALLLGSTPTIFPYAVDYLRYICIGIPFMTGSLVLNNLLRFQGSAFYGMLGISSGAILNIGLDPLFIFVFGMGVGGAALATIISQFTGCAILLIGCSRKGNLRINPKEFSPSLKTYAEMFRGGFPSLCRQGISSVAIVILNQFARIHGDAAIAAISIVQRVTMFSYSALIGFGQGFQPVCGFNYGAKRYDRLKRAFWFCVRVSTVILTLLGIVMFIFSTQIIAVFRADDPAVIGIGSLTLRLQAAVFPLFAWVVLNNMMMQTSRKAVRASVLSLARQGIFLLPALFILSPAAGLFGLQLCQPVADICSFLLAIPLHRSVIREFQ